MLESITILLGLAGIAAIGIISPGPDFLAVSHASLSGGRRLAAEVGSGVVLGNVIWAGAALFGVGALFALFPAFYLGFKVLGGSYLIWMGIQMLRSARKPLQTACAAPIKKLGGFQKGLTTTMANPKAAIYYASALTAVTPAGASLGLLSAMLLTVFLIAALWYSCVVFFLTQQGINQLYCKAKSYFEALFGLFIITIGAKQILSSQ